MDLSELAAELDTDLLAAAQGLDRPSPGPTFAMERNRFLTVKRKAQLKAQRRGIKAFIKPENAACIVPHLPAPGDRTHCLLRGDFVLCDLIPTILQARGAAHDVHVATLGLSVANARCLAELKQQKKIRSLLVVCSHYFQQVDKATTFREVEAVLRDVARLVITRSHAKVICLPTAAGDYYAIEASANLRSSDNVEQLCIFNDAETLAFHRDWMEAIAKGEVHG